MHLLLIEDDLVIAKNLKQLLVSHGYAVDHTQTGEEGHERITSGDYDVAVVDRSLPDGDGLAMMKSWRVEGLKTPVLLLTALSQKDEIVKGLDAGADDYLGKPFEIKELLARIRALVRRGVRIPTKPILEIADLKINTNTHEVQRAGAMVPLSPHEYGILEYLAIHAGQAVERITLVSHAWDETVDLFSNALDVHMANLRRKIDSRRKKPLIKTIRGKGYMLCQD